MSCKRCGRSYPEENMDDTLEVCQWCAADMVWEMIEMRDIETEAK